VTVAVTVAVPVAVTVAVAEAVAVTVAVPVAVHQEILLLLRGTRTSRRRRCTMLVSSAGPNAGEALVNVLSSAGRMAPAVGWVGMVTWEYQNAVVRLDAKAIIAAV